MKGRSSEPCGCRIPSCDQHFVLGMAGPPVQRAGSMPAPMLSATDFPARGVRLVEPFGTGGGPDLLGRALAPHLSELWGQEVTVENRPGAGSTAGPAYVAAAPADGHVLLVNTSAHAYSAALAV